MADMNFDIADAWRPEVGDVLIGEVLTVDKGWSDQREAYYPIVTVRPESSVRIAQRNEHGVVVEDKFTTTTEPVAIHCFHTVLYNRVVEAKPKVGERVGCKFVKATEKQKGKKGNTPSVYSFRVEGRQSDVWDVMQEDERTANAKRQVARSASPVEAAHFEPHPEVTNTDDEDIPF